MSGERRDAAASRRADSGAGGHDASDYGRHVAGNYDDIHADLDPGDAVATVHELAAGGAVLELGIGTGRLALPLRARGTAVAGIEGSPEMVAALRAKPGGADIPVTVGDFAEASCGEGYAVVLLAFNTVYALPDQDAQVACFRNAARHLADGGLFLVEAWVPDPGAFHAGRALRPASVSAGRVVVEAATISPAEQRMTTTKVSLDAAGVRVFPANHRYAWPAELDLMARLAGLRLAHRWQDWARRPFTDTSTTHVSAWERISDRAW